MGVKLEKIGADLEKARKKRAEWDAKVKDLERRYREEENTEIHEMVHAANLTPEQLAELIRKSAAFMPQVMAAEVKEDGQYDEYKADVRGISGGGFVYDRISGYSSCCQDRDKRGCGNGRGGSAGNRRSH